MCVFWERRVEDGCVVVCVHVRECESVCVCFGKGGWRMGVWLCVCM